MTGLDAASEASVRDAMRRLTHGKTCLLITHDLQNATEADVILLLENGRITEQGTHENLMVGSAKYQTLFLQKSGAIEASATVN